MRRSAVTESRSKTGPPLLRFAHPLAFASYLRSHGADPDRYLRRNGLPVLCEDPAAFAPLPRIWSFFDDASRQESRGLGWLVGSHVGDRQLNARLLLRLENAPTLLQALHRFIRLYRSEATDLEIGIRQFPGHIWLYTHYPGKKDEIGYHVSQAYQLALFIDLIRHFLGRQWRPSEIGIESSHVPPEIEQCFPGVRVLPRQQAGYVVVQRLSLDRCAPSHYVKIANRINHQGFPLPDPAQTSDFVFKICGVLRAYLSEGYVSERLASEMMDISVRTLTRKLSACGLTYGTLIDDLRFDVAKELLSNKDLPIVEISQLTGFKHQSNFTRMFTRISGMNPMEYRKVTAG